MRVLQVAYRSEIAGGERVLLQLVDALREAGHPVCVACPAPGPLAEALGERGVEVEVIPMRKTYDFGAVRRLGALIDRFGADLVHTHGMLVNILGRMAMRRRPGVASLSTVHLTRDLRGGPRVGGTLEVIKNRLWYRPVDNLTARWNDVVVAVSEAVRDDLVTQGYPASKVRVIRNGISLERFRVEPSAAAAVRKELGVDAGTFLVGAVSRLSPQKDLGTLLEAMEHLRREHPEALAFVAGTGPGGADLRKEIRARDAGEWFRLLGRREDVPALLAACDVFALSSRWEGLPLSALEAMASSRAVVATAVPGTCEAVVDGETGLLVPIGDGAAMGAALAGLAADRDRTRRLGESGRARIEAEFAVERTAGEYLELYQELLTNRS